ncbi:DUF4238 domain-containing protein [Terriglobus albidus]|uniref:DUF4238 domain-containing protein n=1 Tax=Terriglobus albidus TaxID=1592106 RepID=UPI0021DFBE73|nr:DUF4238 domain-containing protein [Terriglobus albidus]
MIGSHTVPESLLRKFSYYHSGTKAQWLWRYTKDRPPYHKQSPKSATRYHGHFVDPLDPAGEAQTEVRLATEYEHPVNQFVHLLGDPSFLATDEQRKQLTQYVTLLFLRSKARREGTKHLQAVKRHALKLFVENESQLLTIATSWNIDLICRGIPLPKPFTAKEVATETLRRFGDLAEPDAHQKQYLVGLRNGMVNLDEPMYQGDWRLVRTSPDKPFIISDSPVVTWQRDAQGTLYHGGGFWRRNIEVFLPVSPTTCLHILPNVERTLVPLEPTVDEINIAQAAFAYKECFANIGKDDIDVLVKKFISTSRIGENVFTVWHRDYSSAIYDALVSRGKRAESRPSSLPIQRQTGTNVDNTPSLPKAIYLDTMLWNRLLDQDVDPQSLHKHLSGKNMRLSLSGHVLYELARTFKNKPDRGQALFRYLKQLIDCGVIVMHDNMEQLHREVVAFRNKSIVQIIASYEEAEYHKMKVEVDKLSEGTYDEHVQQFVAGRSQFSQDSRSRQKEHFEGKDDARQQLQRVSKDQLESWLRAESSSLRGSALLAKHLQRMYSGIPDDEALTVAHRLIRIPHFRMAKSVVRADLYGNWRCAQGGQNPRDLVNDMYHMLNACYCEVYATAEDGQAQYASLLLPSEVRMSIYDDVTPIHEWLLSLA